MTPHAAIIQANLQTVLDDPATSTWLRQALQAALERDPIDAANDAEALAALLIARADGLLRDG